MLEPALQVGVEEAPVLRYQHRGEHPERIAGQFLGIVRPEGGGDHRDRLRLGVAQVIEAGRVHAQRAEDPRHLGQFGGRPDPDRTVAFGGHPIQRTEPFRVATAGVHHPLVHLGRDLDQGVVRRDLTAVELRQPDREAGPQLPGRDQRLVAHLSSFPAVRQSVPANPMRGAGESAPGASMG